MTTPAPATTTASAPATTPATAATPTVADPPAAAATTTSSSLGISTGTAGAMAGVAVFYWVALAIFLLLFHLGAAKMSYDLHQSALWGFISFLLASVYYPYYAFMYSTRRESMSLFGGRKRR